MGAGSSGQPRRTSKPRCTSTPTHYYEFSSGCWPVIKPCSNGPILADLFCNEFSILVCVCFLWQYGTSPSPRQGHLKAANYLQVVNIGNIETIERLTGVLKNNFTLSTDTIQYHSHTFHVGKFFALAAASHVIARKNSSNWSLREKNCAPTSSTERPINPRYNSRALNNDKKNGRQHLYLISIDIVLSEDFSRRVQGTLNDGIYALGRTVLKVCG